MEEALTDLRYWDRVWHFADEHASEAPAIDPNDVVQAELGRLFAERLGPGRRFIEVGAGGSAWPAHVSARHQAEAWGIDFSRPGLARAEQAAARAGVPVSLVEGDLFDPVSLPRGVFDVVYSGGLVEHFPDARPLMERLVELLSPTGVVVTTVPNLDGLNGLLQRWVDRRCFARHVVFTPRSLDAAHGLGGLCPVQPARFLGVLDLGAVNFSQWAARLPPLLLKGIWAGISLSRRAGETIARRVGASHGGHLLAPSLIGVYRR